MKNGHLLPTSTGKRKHYKTIKSPYGVYPQCETKSFPKKTEIFEKHVKEQDINLLPLCNNKFFRKHNCTIRVKKGGPVPVEWHLKKYVWEFVILPTRSMFNV